MSPSPVLITTETLGEGYPFLMRVQHTFGLLTLENLQAMLAALVAAPADMAVLLQSDCAMLPSLAPPEEQAWIIAAGEYREAQESFKRQGGQIISLVTGCIIGGTYLVHGMSASHRLIYEGASVYPSLSPTLYEAIFKRPYPHAHTSLKGLESGIVTEITTPEAWPHRLLQLLGPEQNAAET